MRPIALLGQLQLLRGLRWCFASANIIPHIMADFNTQSQDSVIVSNTLNINNRSQQPDAVGELVRRQTRKRQTLMRAVVVLALELLQKRGQFQSVNP